MNQWDARFQTENFVYGKEPNVFLKDIYTKLSLNKGNALAIAEGEGRNAVFLAQQGMNVTTWDYAESGLAKTRKLAQEKGVEVKTELVDLNQAPWDENKWDQIVCIFGHFPKELREKTLDNVKKAVKPGGHYITEVYSIFQLPYESGGPRDQAFLYSPEDFLKVFSDWKMIHFFMGEVVRHEGEGHNGLSHVIQLVAQKPVE
ncbi:class I SAM-dependent methyltransferase [Neobacillus sp. D3-1R]|uniref:class I SAM-dependent methyltransferase n=1 Tax=Neobacillus sp. D3-1R TaxID=3445778 RepID=UPI003FA045D9